MSEPNARAVLDYFAQHPEDLADIPRMGSEWLLADWDAYVTRHDKRVEA
jgi:hypothetical protein